MTNSEEKISPVKREAIRCATVEGGMSFTEASKHFNVNINTLRSMAHRDEWQTPSVMKAKFAKALRDVKAEEEEELKVAIRLDRFDFNRKREEHRQQMMGAIDKIMTTTTDNGFEHLKVRSIRDLDVLDAMARRTLGSDIADAAEGKLMTLDFSGVKPAEIKSASPPTLVEKEEDDAIDI